MNRIKRVVGLAIAVTALAAFPAAATAASVDAAGVPGSVAFSGGVPGKVAQGGGLPGKKARKAAARPRLLVPNPTGGICPPCVKY